ncbi:carboxylesterase/lipase family protein [Microbacterium luticocti]|uniref:carboxylesterase/lipase family protein n=1 Tax=Microbacterium luticocti TaxID=451764 RepID=UPI0004179DD8|nr:carboxylesterase family protein [Microbacterium luticocti]
MTGDSGAPIVTTDTGRVRGVWRSGSAAFLGIPFAQPPVGERRFAAPVPAEPWDGVRDAVEYGATPQRGEPGITLIPEPSVPGASTLNVNVFTPDPGAAGLPVLVWIHGGGFTAGSPASPWYDGRAFTRDGVVTVTVSYRLGFDGFGHIPGAPANRGVRDWLAALEWVQRNIAAFGGDPARVTIAGQSAGGGAVLTLLGMPQAQHLFHAVWAMSPAVANVSLERAATVSAKLARLGGVPATREGFASLDEATLHRLQEQAAAPESDDALAGITDLLGAGLPLGPMLDGDLLTEPTLEAIGHGIGADKPLVLGATDDEFTMATDPLRAKLRFVPAGMALRRLGLRGPAMRTYLAANRARRRRGTAAAVGRYVTDTMFRAPIVRVATARAQAPTWAYRFTWVSPSIGWACHCVDVPFWWDCLDSPDGIAHLCGPRPPQALADIVHGTAVGFVREHDPGWTPWSRHPGATRLFGVAPSDADMDRDGYASVAALVQAGIRPARG